MKAKKGFLESILNAGRVTIAPRAAIVPRSVMVGIDVVNSEFMNSMLERYDRRIVSNLSKKFQIWDVNPEDLKYVARGKSARAYAVGDENLLVKIREIPFISHNKDAQNSNPHIPPVLQAIFSGVIGFDVGINSLIKASLVLRLDTQSVEEEHLEKLDVEIGKWGCMLDDKKLPNIAILRLRDGKSGYNEIPMVIDGGAVTGVAQKNDIPKDPLWEIDMQNVRRELLTPERHLGIEAALIKQQQIQLAKQNF